MSNNHVISGNVSTEDLQNALSAFYGDKRKIVIVNDNDNDKDKDNGEEDGAASTENDSESNNIDKDNNTNVYININKYNQLSSLLKEKTKELTKLEKTSAKALVGVQTFHLQQKQLFDEFVILRTRYDEQKTQLMETLWDKCSVSHPELSEIPKCENELLFLEDEDRVGIYNLGEVLGEGQFALVRSCNISHSRGIEYAAIHETHDLTREYAMKILSKERLLTFHSLKRVSNEIKILRALDSKYIVKTMDVIQTKKKLYIVTEKGGEDLFEFFDEHPDGVPESWAKDIARCILRGVQYCHQAKICHRDLKPENILVKFDVDNGVCEDLKLCDFGLASEYKSTEPFTDFCGSPGFFAPEMITRGSYFGDKVDIWSCGCILLELVLGHDKFCEIWMVAYDYEVMQEKDQFSNEINTTLRKLMSTLDFSNDFNDFIMNFLRLKPSNRTSIAKLLTHRWLELDEEEKLYYQTISTVRSSASPLTVNDGGGRRGRNRTQSGNLDLSIDIGATGPPIQSPDLSRSSSGQVTGHTDTELLKQAFHNQSSKERKMYEDYNKLHIKDSEQVHLPPIEPQTPNIVQVKKILLKGNDLANKFNSTGAGAGQRGSNSNSNSNSNISTPSHTPGGKGSFNRSPLPSGNGNSWGNSPGPIIMGKLSLTGSLSEPQFNLNHASSNGSSNDNGSSKNDFSLSLADFSGPGTPMTPQSTGVGAGAGAGAGAGISPLIGSPKPMLGHSISSLLPIGEGDTLDDSRSVRSGESKIGKEESKETAAADSNILSLLDATAVAAVGHADADAGASASASTSTDNPPPYEP